jgi:hypothetical protein
MSDTSPNHWNIFGYQVPKSEIVFFSQVILIYTIVITSIVNLSLGTNEGENKVWIALLSSSFGYLLPNPTLKKRMTAATNGI